MDEIAQKIAQQKEDFKRMSPKSMIQQIKKDFDMREKKVPKYIVKSKNSYNSETVVIPENFEKQMVNGLKNILFKFILELRKRNVTVDELYGSNK